MNTLKAILRVVAMLGAGLLLAAKRVDVPDCALNEYFMLV